MMRRRRIECLHNEDVAERLHWPAEARCCLARRIEPKKKDDDDAASRRSHLSTTPAMSQTIPSG